MGWSGYFSLGGTEIINAERTETYLQAARVPWFIPQYNTDAISTLAAETYVNSWVDEPPWGDPDNPDTYRFWGVYPLRVDGLEDSTREAAVTENIGNGASIGPIRAGSRSIVFSAVLLGESECAVEAGFNWLKAALSVGPCDGGGCDGFDLCYFSCEPCLPEGCGDTQQERDDCIAHYARTQRQVQVITGPRITSKRTFSDNCVMWAVTFTAVAGVPFEFGAEIELIEGFGVSNDPWVPEIIPADWAFDINAEEVFDFDCARPAYEPIVDPLCPAIEVPPSVPSIPVGCWTPPESWDRRWFTLPRKYVPYWSDVVPVIRVQAQSAEVRGLRLRFYADLDANASVLEDPCAYCGDILFSYIPPDTTLVFDGVTERVIAEGPGGALQRADSLVFKTDGTPFEWPSLSCGLGYVVAVDFPHDQEGFVMPAIDVSIVPRGGI